jgi:hypothetical protein
MPRAGPLSSSAGGEKLPKSAAHSFRLRAWSLGSVSGNQTITSGGLVLPAPVSSITETMARSLIAGASGNASIDAAIFVKLVPVPEPSTGLLVIAGMLDFAGWRRARA